MKRTNSLVPREGVLSRAWFLISGLILFGCASPTSSRGGARGETVLGVYDSGIVLVAAEDGAVLTLAPHRPGHRVHSPAYDPARRALYYEDLGERKIMRWESGADAPSELWAVPRGYEEAGWLAVSPEGGTLLAHFIARGQSSPPHLLVIKISEGTAQELPLDEAFLRRVWSRFYWKDNSSVFFRTAEDLFLYNVQGQTSKAVLRCKHWDSFSLSPDRKRMALIDPEGTVNLLESEGMTEERSFSIKSVPGYTHDEWALGGSELYLCRGGSSGFGLSRVGGIYAVNLESGNFRQVRKGPFWLSHLTFVPRSAPEK